MTGQPHEPSPPVVPREYTGKWIAWNHERTRIVASGETVAQAIEAAQKAGERNPVLAKAPRDHVRFVGGSR